MTDRHDATVSRQYTRAKFHALGTRAGRGVCHPSVDSRPLQSLVSRGLATKRSFTTDEARALAIELGIDFEALGCDLEQFRMGLGVELEHGPRDPETDVSGNDPIVTGKIALAHLTEFPDYYTRLAVLEREAADHLMAQK
jgi:hypothetical protein